jgi:tetratricopeptide (TPR) repeat protein
MPTSFSSSRRRPLVAAICLLLAFAASPARADDEREFQEHYQRGLQLYKLNYLRQAIKEFVAAYAANPLPRLLYNIAQLQRRISDYKDAAESYELYLRSETDITPERRAEVKRYIEALRTTTGAPIAALPAEPNLPSATGAAKIEPGEPPPLLLILPPTATGKVGRSMFNMGFELRKARTISPVCEAGEADARCRETPFDGHLHLALGTRRAHGPSLGERAWDK